MIKAEVIAIGDELLIGQVINTNAAWIGEQLSLNGIEPSRQSVISDQAEDIMSTLKQAEERADIVLITGGLGPTKDDITKSCMCDFFNSKLVLNEAALENVSQIFSQRGYELTELNRQQAYIPENATYLANPHGTAPGMWFERNNTIFVSMPGVPYEMKHLMTEEVIPRIKARFKLPYIIHKVVMTQGIGESFLSEIIEEWETQLPSFIKLAYLPQAGMVRLRLSARGNDRDVLLNELQTKIDALKELIPDYIYAYDEEKLESALGRLCQQHQLKIATAESCTGGYIGHLITSIAGSSAYYNGGIVSYSNEAKADLLDVPTETIKEKGAVSEEVARAMAEGCRKKLDTDIGIATTGIAGPGGGSEDKPVGTVWIGIADKEKSYAVKYNFGNERERNIRRTALTALDMCRKYILKKENK